MRRKNSPTRKSAEPEPACAVQNCSLDALCLFRSSVSPWAIFQSFLEQNGNGQTVLAVVC